MRSSRPQPDVDRLSTLAALVILSYALVGIVELPLLGVEWTILGLLVPIQIEARVIMVAIAAVLAVVGSDWLMESHPLAGDQPVSTERRILPGLAAVGLGLLVTGLEQGPALWIGLVLAALLLTAVMYAEFIVLDPGDPRREVASIGLEGLAYLLTLQAVFFFRVTGARAVFSVPAMFVFGSAIAWRLFLLRSEESRPEVQALTVGWLLAQGVWALHYWPLEPLRGSLLLVLGYALAFTFAIDSIRERLAPVRALEYAVLASLGLIAILLLAR
jgi:hypothetical protein